MANRARALALYRNLIRESKKFNSYNYRLYALRRTQDAFKENKNETDPDKIESMFKYGEKNLDIIKRQVMIGQLYGEGQLVIENMSQQER